MAVRKPRELRATGMVLRGAQHADACGDGPQEEQDVGDAEGGSGRCGPPVGDEDVEVAEHAQPGDDEGGVGQAAGQQSGLADGDGTSTAAASMTLSWMKREVWKAATMFSVSREWPWEPPIAATLHSALVALQPTREVTAKGVMRLTAGVGPRPGTGTGRVLRKQDEGPDEADVGSGGLHHGGDPAVGEPRHDLDV